MLYSSPQTILLTALVSLSSTLAANSTDLPSKNATTVTTTIPFPTISIKGKHADAVAKAKALLAKMSLEEKVNVTTGIGWMNHNPGLGACVGMIPPISSVGFPGLCLQDSPLGVRFADLVTAYPAGLNVAATWDRKLALRRGKGLGYEFKAKGVNIALGPDMNIMRTPEGGRNFETFGADPYLSGEMAFETVKGIQDMGVIATAKHFIANEQEHNRTSSSSILSDRSMHEIYLAPFARAVEADVLSIMCSYNQVNGTYACENGNLLNGLLKNQLNFQGFVMSDWQATMSGVPSVMNGLDMTMPGDIVFFSNTSYFGKNLGTAVQNGSVPIARLDDMVTRILSTWYHLKQDSPDFPKVSFDSFNPYAPFNKHLNVQKKSAQKVVREIGAASTILLKNKNNALPLKEPQRVLLLGSDAGPNPNGANSCEDRGCNVGTMAMGWGSGTAQFPYLITPYEAIQRKVSEYYGSINWMFNDSDTTTAGKYASLADTTLVFVSTDSGEQYINNGDRNDLKLEKNGDQLIKTAAANCANVIVVAHSVGPADIEEWIDNSNVTALLWAGAPGQESGNSLVDVLWGKVNPSGRLPYTMAKSLKDYSAHVIYNQSGSGDIMQIPYSEDIFVDYRHFDAKNITPRYEFGFGLSYSKFSYSNFQVNKVGKSKDPKNKNLSLVNGNLTSLSKDPKGDSHDYVYKGTNEVIYKASVDVTNESDQDGYEVVQLYLTYPESTKSAPKNLRGFDRVLVPHKQKKMAEFELTRRDLSYWDVISQKWVISNEEYTLSIGKSSRDIQVSKKMTIKS